MKDHERPLNARGRRASDAVARALTARGYPPDVIWASDSSRTRETAKRLIRIIPGAQTISYSPHLYHAASHEILQLLSQQDEPAGRLMVLGHNPGIGELYGQFSTRYHDFPTGACAVFARKTDINSLWTSPLSWRPIDLILPRDLEDDNVT